MGMTDPIADLLTRIRNASSVNHDRVIIPASNLKLRVVNLLLEEGFVRNFKVIQDGLEETPHFNGTGQATGDITSQNNIAAS